MRRHDVERAIPARDLSREELRQEIAKLDVLVIGGGGILFDDEAEIFLREAAVAEELDVPLVVYAVSVGPLENRTTRERLTRCLERAAIVTVRERYSRRLLERIGVRRDIMVTTDPALLVEPAALPGDTFAREGLVEGQTVVGLSVREPGVAAPDLDERHYHQLLADAADYMVYRYDTDIVFVAMERRISDLQQSHAVVSRMAHADRAQVLRAEYSAGEMLSLIGRLDFAIGMRLHFLMFAAMQRVPFVPLAYADKIAGFLRHLDMQIPPVQDMRAGQLIARIDRCWDWRQQVRADIDGRLPALRDRARETNALLVDLLRQRTPRQTPARSSPRVQPPA